MVHEILYGLLDLGSVEDDGEVLDQGHVLVDHGVGVGEYGLVVALGDDLHFLEMTRSAKGFPFIDSIIESRMLNEAGALHSWRVCSCR